MDKKIIAVDLGASGGKLFVGTFHDNGFSFQEIHRFSHEGVSFFIPEANGTVSERTYWDDIYIYSNILTGLQTYRREISDRLDSIGIDTWGADGQFISKNGDLLGKVYCYRDHRLDSMVDFIKQKVDPELVYRITGIHFQPFNLSNQLSWFAENRKELFNLASVYVPVPSLFYYYLGGTTAVDSSWASVTQLMDARLKKWSGDILNPLGISSNVMPEIVKPGTVLGSMHQKTAAMLGLNTADLTAAASHDTASAFAAAPVENTEECLIISSGTWSLVGKLVPEPVTTDFAFQMNLSNEGGIGNIRLLRNCMGTWLIQELRKAWSIEDGREPPWNELVALSEKAEPFTAFINPDDPSFYNPDDMAEAITAFCRKTGQSVPKDRGTFLRVVYESLAMKYRAVNEMICSASGTKTNTVHIVGGGSKNEMLNQFTADALGMPVIAGPDEATAAGNLMVQALGQGIIPSLSASLPLIKDAFSINTFMPREQKLWDRKYADFKRVGID